MLKNLANRFPSPLRRLIHWLDVTITERRMWWRYVRNKKKYQKTRQWLFVGGDSPRDIPPAQAYREVLKFVKETVNLSPRPYGHGAYSLVVAAAWPEEDHNDRVQIDFKYSEREDVYRELAVRMVAWEPAPMSIMAGVLPYGALTEGL